MADLAVIPDRNLPPTFNRSTEMLLGLFTEIPSQWLESAIAVAL